MLKGRLLTNLHRKALCLIIIGQEEASGGEINGSWRSPYEKDRSFVIFGREKGEKKEGFSRGFA